MEIVPSSFEGEQEIVIPAGTVALRGSLSQPPHSHGVVLFAHGSGSGRHSPRNRSVAERLQEVGLSTLLMDLLTEGEEGVDIHTGHLRFDIEMLATRLQNVVAWLERDERTRRLAIGLFGASTGAAAAIVAAARLGDRVSAVVSRGGRTDLAEADLQRLRCPVLMIAGSRDPDVLELNRGSLLQLGSPVKKLVVIPGAGHLFEEPGRLGEVSRLAGEWFRTYLRRGRTAS